MARMKGITDQKKSGRCWMFAGLNVLRIINEPTAAALAYGLDNEDAGSERLVEPAELAAELACELSGGGDQQGDRCRDPGLRSLLRCVVRRGSGDGLGEEQT